MKSKTGFYYTSGLRIIWILVFVLVFLSKKLELHKTINSFHSPFLDVFAPIATNVGDGLFLILISLLFLFIEIRIAILLFVSFLISSGLVQFLKHIIFENENRPMFFFQNDLSFHKIEGFTYYFYNSFPSGHATSCFVLFTILAYYWSSKIWLQISLLVCAIIFALTRVYLSQHFVEDILAGSIIGSFTANYTWLFLNQRLTKLNGSILNRIKKKNQSA